MDHKHASPPISLEGLTILQVIPALETGGAERTTLELGKAIVTAGGRSLVVSEGGPMLAQLEEEGSTHITLPAASKNPLTIWANRAVLINIIREQKVDLIHARSRAPAWSALWAARATGIPFVTTYHGIYNAKTTPKRLYNSVMARGDLVIANSNYTADAVRSAYGSSSFFNNKKMIVIHRGADLSRFDPSGLNEDRRRATLKAFGGERAFRVLLPGRLTSWKGQLVMVKAAGLLQRHGELPPFRLVLTGSAQGRDGYEAEVQQALEDEGVTASVHIQGHWEDMPAAYDWADVTISASTRPEAFGRVAVEAQAMGCPVIATAHGGALETVDEGQTGYLVPPGDAEALARAIQTMMSLSKIEFKKMKSRSRSRIEAHFSIETMTSGTLSAYKTLVTKTARAGAATGQVAI